MWIKRRRNALALELTVPALSNTWILPDHLFYRRLLIKIAPAIGSLCLAKNIILAIVASIQCSQIVLKVKQQTHTADVHSVTMLQLRPYLKRAGSYTVQYNSWLRSRLNYGHSLYYGQLCWSGLIHL